MNAKRLIIMISFIASTLLHGMDRRRRLGNQAQTDTSYSQQFCSTARQAAVAISVSAPFLLGVGVVCGSVAYTACSHMQSDHSDTTQCRLYTTAGVVAGSAISGLLIAECNKYQYNQRKNKQKNQV